MQRLVAVCISFMDEGISEIHPDQGQISEKMRNMSEN